MLHRTQGGCISSMVASALVIIGGLNWGLVGLGMLLDKDLNLVHSAFGGIPAAEAIIYILVGLATIGVIIGCKCEKCKMVCK